MTRFPRLNDLIQKLGDRWRRFWALSWRWKVPTLGGAAALVALVIVVAAVAVSGGGSSDNGGLVGFPTVTPTSEPSPMPTPTPALPPPQPTEPPPSPPGPTPTAAPAEGAYALVAALPAATFDRMLGFATIPGPGDNAVIVTQGGEVWRVPLGGGSPALYGDLSGLLISSPGNEEGLLGLAFSPGFQSDGRVYVYYTAGNPRRSVLSRFRVVSGSIDPGSETVILEVAQPFANHNGGQIAFGPDGYLYVALGDGGAGGDPQGNGQDLSTLLGSILRLDVSGSGYAVPPDNPFVGTPGARGEIYAYGLRNPWRFSFDRASGDIWAADVGQNRWEEVDRIVAGGNYGWNVMEGFECFQPPSGCSVAGLRLPRAAYPNGVDCSVTGGFVYRGSSLPELDGWYVYGDFCSGHIWAVNTADDSPPVLLAETGLPIASFGELPDGELLALTFANAVFRLTRS